MFSLLQSADFFTIDSSTKVVSSRGGEGLEKDVGYLATWPCV